MRPGPAGNRRRPSLNDRIVWLLFRSDIVQTPVHRRGIAAYGLLIAYVLAAGCSTVQKAFPPAAWHQARVRNEGYGLLYKLLSQESGVDKVFIVKQANPAVADLIKNIASSCGQAKKEMEQFHERDPHLILDVAHLPEIEQKTRDAIQSTEGKQLLFSSGKTFETRLLVTQAEAMNYAAHLAKVLHDQDEDPARKEFLVTLFHHCTDLREKVMDLLQSPHR
jgi:hypothetical protein